MLMTQQRDDLRQLLNAANVKNEKTNFKRALGWERRKDLQQYNSALEERNKELNLQNSRLQVENLKLQKEVEMTRLLKQRLDNAVKDKNRLIKLMKQSKEFRLLGFLSGEQNEISFLHSLGMFSDYDVEQIKFQQSKVLNRNTLDLPNFSGKLFEKLPIRECVKRKLCYEEQLWVESDIYDFVVNWREENRDNFTDQSIELLIFTLNTRFLSKIRTFRKSAHLFCKNCGGLPKSSKSQKLFSKTNSRMNDHVKTLNRFERSKIFEISLTYPT